MKRHKKLWIALVALTVVVGLCALALISRPAPYEFLRDASLQSYGIVSSPTGDLLLSRYRLKGSWEDTVNAAQRELTSEDGWKRSEDAAEVEFNSYPKGVSVNVSVGFRLVDDEFRRVPVTVIVLRPATPLDRLRTWILPKPLPGPGGTP